MEEALRKELIVSAIENGTVIDHIPSTAVMRVMKILELEKSKNQVLFGMNLESRKFGKKGIIKVRDTFFEPIEINKIALVAPSASLTVIRDFKVVEKKMVEIPDFVAGFIKCFNPKCVTNHENVPTKFNVIDKIEIRLFCHYCEKITKKEHIQFI